MYEIVDERKTHPKTAFWELADGAWFVYDTGLHQKMWGASATNSFKYGEIGESYQAPQPAYFANDDMVTPVPVRIVIIDEEPNP